MNDIRIHVRTGDESRQIEIPAGIQLSLMEVLKAAEFPVLATCGGMAICATCHVEVLEGNEEQKQATDTELEMLDMLPEVKPSSRLACQMPVNEAMDGLVIRILADMDVPV